ncbi:MAG: peptidylprolyl isomerase [Clostridia bacterium]|nr:peptidylprolyl isomerase [Clostridia bacterium]
MKMLSRLLALTLALLLCLPALAETTPEDVLVTINGSSVTRTEYETCLTSLQDTYASYGYDVTDPTMAAILQQMALETAMQYEMLQFKIVELGLQLTDEELADAAQLAREDFSLQVDLIVDQYGLYGLADVSTEAGRAAVMVEVLSQLEAMGITEASYIAMSQTNAGYDKVYDWVVRDVSVTEEEIRAHFDALVDADRVAYANDVAAYEAMLESNRYALMYGMTEYYVDLYYVPEGYRSLTHILLQADDTALANWTALNANGADPAEIAAAEAAVLASVQPSVDEINARLAAGESFASLIPEYTIDTGMMDESAIAAGYELHAQSTGWAEPFQAAAFTLTQVGEISAPVVSDFGVHIICYAADVPGGPVPYTDDVRALLSEALLSPRQSSLFEETLAAWMAEAEIAYSEEAQTLLSAY